MFYKEYKKFEERGKEAIFKNCMPFVVIYGYQKDVLGNCTFDIRSYSSKEACIKEPAYFLQRRKLQIKVTLSKMKECDDKCYLYPLAESIFAVRSFQEEWGKEQAEKKQLIETEEKEKLSEVVSSLQAEFQVAQIGVKKEIDNLAEQAAEISVQIKPLVTEKQSLENKKKPTKAETARIKELEAEIETLNNSRKPIMEEISSLNKEVEKLENQFNVDMETASKETEEKIKVRNQEMMKEYEEKEKEIYDYHGVEKP